MDGNAPHRGPARGWLVGFVVIGLVAAVAIASTGRVPGGEAGVRRPADQLLDVVLSLLVVLLLVGGVVALLLFAVFRRDDAVASAARGSRRSRPAQALASAAMGVVLVLVAVRFVKSDDGREAGDGVIPGLDQVPGLADEQRGRYEPEFTLWPVIVMLVLALAAATAIALERRARRNARGPQLPVAPEEALADVLDDTLDDLRAETDPRRAVIDAYARMERALRAAGLARRETEAPEEYLARVVDGIELSRRAAGRLTALFTWARFSGHDVRPEMKNEAIDTLEVVRDELRAVAARREALEAARLAEATA